MNTRSLALGAAALLGGSLARADVSDQCRAAVASWCAEPAQASSRSCPQMLNLVNGETRGYPDSTIEGIRMQVVGQFRAQCLESFPERQEGERIENRYSSRAGFGQTEETPDIRAVEPQQHDMADGFVDGFRDFHSRYLQREGQIAGIQGALQICGHDFGSPSVDGRSASSRPGEDREAAIVLGTRRDCADLDFDDN